MPSLGLHMRFGEARGGRDTASTVGARDVNY